MLSLARRGLHCVLRCALAVDKYNRVLTGAKSDVPQWQRCVWRTSDALGMAVGRLFVDAAFGQNAKNTADDMVSDVLAAFIGACCCSACISAVAMRLFCMRNASY